VGFDTVASRPASRAHRPCSVKT